MSRFSTECDHPENHKVMPATGTAIDPMPPTCVCDKSGTCPIEGMRARAMINYQRKREAPPTQTVTNTGTAARFSSN